MVTTFHLIISLFVFIFILLFYSNENDDMTLYILSGGFESIPMIYFTDPP